MSRYPELTKRFKALAGNRHLVQLFHDFVETFAISLRNAVDRHEWQEREDRYLEVTKNYSDGAASLPPSDSMARPTTSAASRPSGRPKPSSLRGGGSTCPTHTATEPRLRNPKGKP